MLKTELRKIFIEKRNQLSEAEYLKRNEAVRDKLLQLFKDLPSNLTIASFLPIAQKKELETGPIHDALNAFPFLHRLVFPRVTTANAMEFYGIESKLDLEISDWGIPEPRVNQQLWVAPDQIDVMLVPLLAFDTNGHRVGYGKGYYDQYLVSCSPKMKKIGLSLFSESVQIDDVENTDIALDSIIFP